MSMRRVFLMMLPLIAGASLFAATPEQEKAFVEAYKKAFLAKDEKALLAFLYTKGAHPMALEFYSLMMTEGAGAKNATFDLLDLTPEEAKKAAEVQEGPDGTKARLPLKPVKRLVIKVSTAEGDSSSTSTSQVFVAEAEGKLVIPVPVPAK
jgi:hypothetical protein